VTSHTRARLESIERDPAFHQFAAHRRRFAWVLSILMLVIYFGFIALVAFAPQSLGQPIGNGVTSIGLLAGLFVIVSAFLLTALYVWRANTSFDQSIKAITECNR
jgi:uncharacterized membrane protein (DUF485 family)